MITNSVILNSIDFNRCTKIVWIHIQALYSYRGLFFSYLAINSRIGSDFATLFYIENWMSSNNGSPSRNNRLMNRLSKDLISKRVSHDVRNPFGNHLCLLFNIDWNNQLEANVSSHVINACSSSSIIRITVFQPAHVTLISLIR